MSPSGCGTAERSVSTRPASGSSTTPVPRKHKLSFSTLPAVMTMPMSKLWTVRKDTRHKLDDSAAFASPPRLFRARFFGGGSASPSAGATDATALGAWLSAEANAAASSSTASGAWPNKSRGAHVREARSNVHERDTLQWRCILTGVSVLPRSLALFGSIQPTVKYSLQGICCNAFSKVCRSWQGLPLMSTMMESVFTDSPNTNPACATYTPCNGTWCLMAVWYGTSWKTPKPSSRKPCGMNSCWS
mmetsp:Transcript_124145/g.356611  ORF Transcript_124145/g.356611 Transcript_124145/m.356611 type:complete len:246 (-) Transcript_124145:1086-1823(-)